MTLHKRFSQDIENIIIAYFGGLVFGMALMLAFIYCRIVWLKKTRRNTLKISNRSSLVLPTIVSPSFVESVNAEVIQRADSVKTLNMESQDMIQIPKSDLEANALPALPDDESRLEQTIHESSISNTKKLTTHMGESALALVLGDYNTSHESSNSNTKKLTTHMGESALVLVLGDYDENDDPIKIVES